MYKTPSEARVINRKIKTFGKGCTGRSGGVSSFYCLPAAREALDGSNIKLGAQRYCIGEEQGAFTGEVAPGMLKKQAWSMSL